MEHQRVGRSGEGWDRFEDWAEEWLRTTIHLKPTTPAGYESILRGRLLPHFAGARVAAIDRVDVLRLVFATAMGSGVVGSNPCEGVRMPRSPRQEMLFLEPPQLLALAGAINPRYRALVLVAGYTGLRAGELGALRPRSLDLVRATLDVRESLADVKGRLVFGPTKTHASRRVHLSAFLCDVIAAHPGDYSPAADGLVFTSPTGAPLRHNLFYARHFKPAVARAGLPSALRFHDLRLTCAAMLIAQGAHPRAMMERLGHSTIQVTLDRYGHRQLRQRASELLRRVSAGGTIEITDRGRALACWSRASLVQSHSGSGSRADQFDVPTECRNQHLEVVVVRCDDVVPIV